MSSATAWPMLPDVQSRPDARRLGLEAAGIRDLRCPVRILTGRRIVATVATFTMSVELPAAVKGTHMSRFVELIESQTRPLDQRRFQALLFDMLARLHAQRGAIELRFPYFVTKAAPVSRVRSQLDYEVCWRGRVSPESGYRFWMQVSVPATSLCPCSKEISDYGAHNQRSIIRIEAELAGELDIEDLLAAAERSASCEVYGLLKRVDEKFVTERAYQNPKFAEDLVRDVALELNQQPLVLSYVVEAENLESIHNHSAFARLVRPSPAAS